MEPEDSKLKDMAELFKKTVAEAQEDGSERYDKFLEWMKEEGNDLMMKAYTENTSLVAFAESCVVGKYFPSTPPPLSGQLAWEAFTPLIAIGYYMGELALRKQDAELKQMLES